MEVCLHRHSTINKTQSNNKSNQRMSPRVVDYTWFSNMIIYHSSQVKAKKKKKIEMWIGFGPGFGRDTLVKNAIASIVSFSR